MVTFIDGKYSLPEDLYYNSNHVYCNKKKGLVGLDQLGYGILKNPKKIEFLVDSEVKKGQMFAKIIHEYGEKMLKSPCSGKIKSKNANALDHMEVDTYTEGYLLKLEDVEELDDGLITGEKVEDWGNKEAAFLMDNSFSFKIVQLGDSAVGKTAIKVRLTDDYFKQDLKTTFGVDFGTKELKVSASVNEDTMFTGSKEYNVKMLVWDVAGQEHYEKTRGMYYRGARAALLVYDVTNPVSFEHLDKWIDEIELNVGRKLPVLVVGNKIDLERKVPREKAESYAKDKGYLYSETSAKTGEGIVEAFKNLAVKLIDDAL